MTVGGLFERITEGENVSEVKKKQSSAQRALLRLLVLMTLAPGETRAGASKGRDGACPALAKFGQKTNATCDQEGCRVLHFRSDKTPEVPWLPVGLSLLLAENLASKESWFAARYFTRH